MLDAEPFQTEATEEEALIGSSSEEQEEADAAVCNVSSSSTSTISQYTTELRDDDVMLGRGKNPFTIYTGMCRPFF
jgi:hypothetical protein